MIWPLKISKHIITTFSWSIARLVSRPFAPDQMKLCMFPAINCIQHNTEVNTFSLNIRSCNCLIRATQSGFIRSATVSYFCYKSSILQALNNHHSLIPKKIRHKYRIIILWKKNSNSRKYLSKCFTAWLIEFSVSQEHFCTSEIVNSTPIYNLHSWF